MNEQSLQFRVGLVVLIAAGLVAALILMFGELPGVLRDRMTIFIRFAEAPGVTANTPVRKHGVLIGRVTEVELEDDGVLVTARIDAHRTLRQNEICRIRTQSLLGDAVLEFVPSGDRDADTTPIKDREYLDGVVASDPLRVLGNLEKDITSAIQSIDDAGNRVGTLAGSLDTVVTDNKDRFADILYKSELALDRFHDTMAAIGDVVSDDELRDRLKKALEDLPTVIENAQEAFAGLRRVTDRAEVNLRNLEGFTEPLGEQGEQIVSDFDQMVRRLDELLAQFVTFGETLNSGEGTLGRLLRDPDLYLNLTRAASNIEKATRRLEPILNDVRVFTDKIAREPGRIGVRGALDRRRLPVK